MQPSPSASLSKTRDGLCFWFWFRFWLRYGWRSGHSNYHTTSFSRSSLSDTTPLSMNICMSNDISPLPSPSRRIPPFSPYILCMTPIFPVCLPLPAHLWPQLCARTSMPPSLPSPDLEDETVWPSTPPEKPRLPAVLGPAYPTRPDRCDILALPHCSVFAINLSAALAAVYGPATTVSLTFGGERHTFLPHLVVMWDSGASLGVEPKGSPNYHPGPPGATTSVTTIHGSTSYPLGGSLRGGVSYPSVCTAFRHGIMPGAALTDCEGEFDSSSLRVRLYGPDAVRTFLFRRADDGLFYNTEGLATPESEEPLAPHLPAAPLPVDEVRYSTDNNDPPRGPDTPAHVLTLVCSAEEVRAATTAIEDRAKLRLGYSAVTPWNVVLQGYYERLLCPSLPRF